MNHNIVGLLVSYVMVFSFIGFATFLLGKGVLKPYETRKIVHIGVSHWWLLYMALMDSPWTGMIGPVSFIIINWVSYKAHIFKAMEDPEPTRNLGTIYFPVSLLILVGLAGFGIVERWEAAVGVMVLGWGDGLAAVVGKRFGKTPFKIFSQTKTIPGTIALILASSAATLFLSLVFSPGIDAWTLLLRSGSVGLFAALVELNTPKGFDNITLPILTTLFFHYVALTPMAGPFAAAAALNGIVAFGAFRKQAVDASGAAVGAAVGTAILFAGGFPAYALLVGFFLSSTAVGRIFVGKRLDRRIEEKGSRRDAFQVLANAGTAAIAAVLYAITKDVIWLVAFATAFAEANADTWASEIGVLYRKLPRSILSGKELQPGASGGVSPLGFFASALGAAFIGLLFAAAYGGLGLVPNASWGLVALIAAGSGFAGAVIDSLLGAAIQAQYTCAVTGRYTERPITDGKPNILVRGYRWVTNDMVNFLSTVSATALSTIVYVVIR